MDSLWLLPKLDVVVVHASKSIPQEPKAEESQTHG